MSLSVFHLLLRTVKLRPAIGDLLLSVCDLLFTIGQFFLCITELLFAIFVLFFSIIVFLLAIIQLFLCIAQFFFGFFFSVLELFSGVIQLLIGFCDDLIVAQSTLLFFDAFHPFPYLLDEIVISVSIADHIIRCVNLDIDLGKNFLVKIFRKDVPETTDLTGTKSCVSSVK